MKRFLITTLAVAGLAWSTSAAAAFSQILTPDAGYVSSTTLLPIAGDINSSISSVSSGGYTVSFNAAQVRAVGDGWMTWGSPPDTEGSSPRVVTDYETSSYTFTFSQRLSIFGLELEGDPFDTQTFTAQFYDGATLVGSFSRDIEGNAGARLLAASGSFTSAVIFGQVDFAFAQVRVAGAVPEPATWAMFVVGFGLAGVAMRRGRPLAA